MNYKERFSNIKTDSGNSFSLFEREDGSFFVRITEKGSKEPHLSVNLDFLIDECLRNERR